MGALLTLPGGSGGLSRQDINGNSKGCYVGYRGTNLLAKYP